MKKFKLLREQYLTEGYAKRMSEKEVKAIEKKYGPLEDQERADYLDKQYSPSKIARGDSWLAISYPVKDGEYYFALLGNQRQGKHWNDIMNAKLQSLAKTTNDPDKLYNDFYDWAESDVPSRAGVGDTMTREEIWAACLHILKKRIPTVDMDDYVPEGFFKNLLKRFKRGIRLVKPRSKPKKIREDVNEIDTILEKAYDANDVKKVQALEKKLKAMLKEVDKTMRGSGISAPAFSMVRGGVRKSLESIEKFYKVANNSKAESIDEKYRSKFPSSLVAAAVKIAIDMGGNMTGAYKKIERMKRGLGDDPMVADALKQANESVNEGIMKKMSQIQIKRKYGRVIKKALSKGSLELPADAEEALYMYAFDNGEIKTDDPDEFTDWLDNNLKDFV